MKKHVITTGILLTILAVFGVIIFGMYTYPGFGEILVGGVLVFVCCMLALVVYAAILGGVENYLEHRDYRKYLKSQKNSS